MSPHLVLLVYMYINPKVSYWCRSQIAYNYIKSCYPPQSVMGPIIGLSILSYTKEHKNKMHSLKVSNIKHVNNNSAGSWTTLWYGHYTKQQQTHVTNHKGVWDITLAAVVTLVYSEAFTLKCINPSSLNLQLHSQCPWVKATIDLQYHKVILIW